MNQKPKSTYNERDISQQNNYKKFTSNFIFEKKLFKKAFSKRINAQGVDTNTHMITKIIIYMIKITQYQLAENECIFHVTLVQSCNTTASYK